MHWIRDQVANGIVSLVYVPTDKQVADIFTKTLNKVLFLLNRDCLVKDTNLWLTRRELWGSITQQSCNLSYNSLSSYSCYCGVFCLLLV